MVHCTATGPSAKKRIVVEPQTYNCLVADVEKRNWSLLRADINYTYDDGGRYIINISPRIHGVVDL